MPFFKLSNLAVIAISFTFLSCTSSCSKEADAKENPQISDTTSIPQPKPDIENDITLPVNRFGITMDQFIGANGAHEDDPAFMQAIGTLRAYCNWDWFQGDSPNNEFIFQYSRSGWYFDDAFKKINDAGVSPIICLHHTLMALRAGNKDDSHDEDKPLDAQGLKATDPNSYKYFSNAVYQLAARYGRTKVADHLLKVPADQKKSALDLVKYIEVWNEPDKTWKGPDGNFTPEEYAALLSISYDKIKEADPTMKVVMAGLAGGQDFDYLKKMDAWFKANRKDKKFPADVINMHIYAFNNGVSWDPYNVFGPAETPEDANFYKITSGMVKFAKEIAPEAEFWISEFGWDTNKKSVLTPKPISELTLNELQARYIVRGFLTFTAAGVDRAHVFTLIDPSQDYIATQYGTSGLISRTEWGKKKPSWYYVQIMKNTLKNMYYIGEEQSTNHPEIKIYKFKDIASDKGAYVVWSATSKNNIENNFTLNLNNNASTAEKTILTEKINGEKADLTISNHSVKIDVSEKPVFITVDNIK